MSNICFREHVQPDDADAVRCLAESTGFFRADETRVAVELVEEKLRDGEKSSYRFLFAECGGQTLGYACFGEIPCTIGSYDLYWIVVDPNRQGEGVGRNLMEKTEAEVAVRGGRRIYVETSSTARYLPTRCFYERCGYSVAARLTDFYAPGDSKLIYVKAVAGHSISQSASRECAVSATGFFPNQGTKKRQHANQKKAL
jgi:ribosomal protein S18 acetylase RimI-like enzyme